MVFSFSKAGSIFKQAGLLVLIGVIIVGAIIFWPGGDAKKEVLPPEYENTINPGSKSEESTPPLTNDFFADYRLSRERARSRQIDLLREVLGSSAEADARKEASTRLVEISETMEKELQLEGMIKSNGYSDCVVLLQEKTALIIVLDESISIDRKEELAEIAELVTGYDRNKLCFIFRQQG